MGGGGADVCLRGKKRYGENVVLLWVMLFCRNLWWTRGFGCQIQ
ncbi:hypothetical protein A2U01_0042581, partial [Trifolium medium]|nr:hypothetical protein [Trifolium medium]